MTQRKPTPTYTPEFCARGVRLAGTRILGEGDLCGLLVERFDRRIDGIHVHRIHQEDFCQALDLGIGPFEFDAVPVNRPND